MQECVSTATSLKALREDGRYDIICSGSLMGNNYKKIESNSVGNKEDYKLHSMENYNPNNYRIYFGDTRIINRIT